MSSLYKSGLVVGKFSPLHRGHELIISYALSRCDVLDVISYVKPEFRGCERAIRDEWLRARFPTANRLVLDDSSLLKLCDSKGLMPLSMIPRDDAPDRVHREFVAWLCVNFLGNKVDCVFTSEEYGDGFAEALTELCRRHVDHVCVDRDRINCPISGSRIRCDPHANRHHLSEQVYASFIKRVCILGGESSGKTTLAKGLAQALGTVWVPEFGRELWEEKGGSLTFEDMLDIGRSQARREDEMALKANRFLICDTSALTTMFYSNNLFGRVDPELARLADRSYDSYLLCHPDFEFVQDGTRRDDAFRQCQFNWYREEFRRREIVYANLKGDLERRLNAAVSVITKPDD